MLTVFGLHISVVLVVIHNTVAKNFMQSQQSIPISTQITYETSQPRAYTRIHQYPNYAQQSPAFVEQPSPPKYFQPVADTNDKLIHQPLQISDTGSAPFQPKITETRIIKHPDEKIVHHPSHIHVKRPPTFVTIEHPDIVIEPSPVVYHKPAAVVRSPIVYKSLPRKVHLREVVKHVVPSLEKKVFVEKPTQPKSSQYETHQIVFPPKIIYQQKQQPFSYEDSNESREIIDSSANPTVTRVTYQQQTGRSDQLRQHNEMRETYEAQPTQIHQIYQVNPHQVHAPVGYSSSQQSSVEQNSQPEPQVIYKFETKNQPPREQIYIQSSQQKPIGGHFVSSNQHSNTPQTYGRNQAATYYETTSPTVSYSRIVSQPPNVQQVFEQSTQQNQAIRSNVGKQLTRVVYE